MVIKKSMLRYKPPSKAWSRLHAENEGKKTSNCFFNAPGSPAGKRVPRCGPDSLNVWKNAYAQLTPYIKKNAQGMDMVPKSTWFVQWRRDLSNAFRFYGGYKGVIKRLINEGALAPDYVQVKDDHPDAAPSGSMSVWGNFILAMEKICSKLGHFPKTNAELKAAGHESMGQAIIRNFGSLADVEARMRAEGRLAFLEQMKKGAAAENRPASA